MKIPTITEYRTNPEWVKTARVVLSNPDVQMMLAVLRNNGPEFRTQPTGLNPTDAVTRLGHVCGYAEHHANFESLGEYAENTATVEATYEQPPEEDEV